MTMEIRFDAVSKVWPDGTRALDDVSFTVPAGQFCVLLGHSGAGKSTLLRCVNGLETPTGGRVAVAGQAVGPATLQGLRRQIAMVHQHFGLVPRASGAANVMAGAVASLPLWRVLTGVYPTVLEDRVCELLKAVGLEEAHLLRRAERLSGGQQQRLGLARAFMLDPAIILADEPVASLDPAISRDVAAAQPGSRTLRHGRVQPASARSRARLRRSRGGAARRTGDFRRAAGCP
jgi:phosphonate transport system ATP-binding protein